MGAGDGAGEMTNRSNRPEGWDDNDQLIGLRDNLQDNPIPHGEIGMISCNVSLKPIN